VLSELGPRDPDDARQVLEKLGLADDAARLRALRER
jgi:hypothetical protein